VKKLWRELSNAGVTTDLPYEVVRRIRLLNLVSLLGSLSLLFYFVLNVFTGKVILGIFEFIFACLLALNIFLNHKRHYQLASILFLIELYLLASIIAIYLSPNRNNEYVFLVIGVMPLILFKNKKLVYTLFALSLLFFILAKIMVEGRQDLILYLNYALIFFLLFFVVKYLKDEFENHRNVIESKNIQLEKLNAEKNQLISIASHDLRSPLSRIQSLLSLLSMEGSLSPEQKEILRTAQREAKQQTEMISEILDLYAMDEGRKSLKLERVDVPGMIKSLLEVSLSIANQKNITVNFENKAEHCECMADESYLKQVFDNLLSNAIKFSYANSKIIILLKSTEQTLQVSFKDEGQGLDAEDQKKLFKRFQRLSAKPTAGEVTSGLGLSIAKKYTDAMGGSLTCVSEKGKGATFTVELLLAT